jgi:nucleoside-diphosphate-sugar epimerase
MKIGVSGASGHLGSAVVSELLKRASGHEVVAITRAPETVSGPVQGRFGDYDRPESLAEAYADLVLRFRWLEEMPGHMFRDLLADPGSGVGRVSVVHAAINASILHFLKRLREATEGAHGICQTRDLAVYGEVKAIHSEEEFQHR